MRSHKLISALLLGLALAAAFASGSSAEEESITITIDRKTMPQSLLHPGRFFTKQETVTVYDYVIRNYLGKPIEDFIVQTAAGMTKIPVDTVTEIRFRNWIKTRTSDIPNIERVVEAEMFFTDGTMMQVLMNADFGTIEGRTELGDFFLKDPATVRHLVFNRVEEPLIEEEPEVVEQPAAPTIEPEKPAAPLDSDGDGVPDYRDDCPGTPPGVEVDENGCPPDSDGDGVPDYKDKCPDTPRGAPVNEAGCWTIKGINFDYNKWDIKPQYHGALDESLRVLRMNPTMTVEIQGHTDDIASEQYNQILSEKRAQATSDYFVTKGIEADRISTRGFGEMKPIAPNDTPENQARNRRIEIKILTR